MQPRAVFGTAVESTTARLQAAPSGNLVAPVLRRTENPLLQGVAATTTSMSSSLFPKVSPTRGGLVKPTVGGGLANRDDERAGATFWRSSGEGAQMQYADRLVHAIDGLRKAQEDYKNLSKGTLASIKGGTATNAISPSSPICCGCA